FFYIPLLMLLAGLLVAGKQVFGSKRWVTLPGGTQFQVSDFVKLVIILALARYFSESRMETVTIGDLAKIGLLAGLPMAMILLQPDLGTALTIAPVVAVAVFLAGLQWKHVVILVVAFALAAPGAWLFMLKPYQK